MRKLIAASLFAMLASGTAQAATQLTKRVYASPTTAARNITISKLYASWGGHLFALGHVKFAMRLVSSKGNTRKYRVSYAALNISRTASVMKVRGGWRALK